MIHFLCFILISLKAKLECLYMKISLLIRDDRRKSLNCSLLQENNLQVQAMFQRFPLLIKRDILLLYRMNLCRFNCFAGDQWSRQLKRQFQLIRQTPQTTRICILKYFHAFI